MSQMWRQNRNGINQCKWEWCKGWFRSASIITPKKTGEMIGILTSMNYGTVMLHSHILTFS